MLGIPLCVSPLLSNTFRVYLLPLHLSSHFWLGVISIRFSFLVFSCSWIWRVRVNAWGLRCAYQFLSLGLHLKVLCSHLQRQVKYTCLQLNDCHFVWVKDVSMCLFFVFLSSTFMTCHMSLFSTIKLFIF